MRSAESQSAAKAALLYSTDAASRSMAGHMRSEAHTGLPTVQQEVLFDDFGAKP